MKTGMSLPQLAQELSRQQQWKRDFLVLDRAMHLVQVPIDDQPRLLLAFGQEQWPVQPYAHGQLAQHLGIPKAYYDRLLRTPRACWRQM